MIPSGAPTSPQFRANAKAALIDADLQKALGFVAVIAGWVTA